MPIKLFFGVKRTNPRDETNYVAFDGEIFLSFSARFITKDTHFITVFYAILLNSLAIIS